MLGEALSFPRRGDGATRDLVVGGLLVLTSPMLVPALVLFGHLLAVMDAGARDRAAPPPLGGYGALLVDGLKGTVVVVVWGLLPVVVAVGGSAAALFYFVLPLPPAAGLDATAVFAASTTELALAGAVVAALALFAFLAVLHLPAALVALGTQGRLAAAFRPGALWAVVNTREYLGGVVLALVVYVLGSLVAAPLSVVVVGLVLLFYVQVSAAYVVGRAVGGGAGAALGG